MRSAVEQRERVERYPILSYGVSPFDPLALGAALAILVGSAGAAVLTPVRRATRVDPADATRGR